MADAEGREIFAFVPRREAIAGAGAFVAPDFFSDAVGFGVGDFDFAGETGRDPECEASNRSQQTRSH
jgi:hypothetical protein